MISTRSATLVHFKSLAGDCGMDAIALINEVGLPTRALVDPDLIIPAHRVAQLLEIAAERAREPAFGLRMAASRRLSNLGALGLLLRDQPTLRQALGTLIARLHLHNEALMLDTVERDDVLLIRCDVSLGREMEHSQAIDAVMGTNFRFVQALLGDRWLPRQVCFRRSQPLDTGWYKRILGPSVKFGCEHNEIVCSIRDLEVPTAEADPGMTIYSQRLLSDRVVDRATTADPTKRLIKQLLPRGLCRADIVAQHLGLSRRTLDSQLASEKTTFKALVNNVRDELLVDYRQAKTITLAEIAPMLGFSELSALSRWHRARFGSSPTKNTTG